MIPVHEPALGPLVVIAGGLTLLAIIALGAEVLATRFRWW